jgi:cyclopropane fatty-acyl-phospholipid synthase-like methyltransferase
MSLIYRIMYRVGFTPWDTGEVPGELAALIEGDAAIPAGRALDIGCGTGTQSVYMARNGWKVTGVELLDQPLRRARDRAAAAGVAVEWIKADVTRLAEAGLEPGYTLLFDRGCYHGLGEQQRAAYALGATELAAPGATLLLMAFASNRVLAGPQGADREQIAAGFESGWTLDSTAPDSSAPPAGPLRNVPLTWYWLHRSS